MAKVQIKEVVARHGAGAPHGQESIEDKVNMALREIEGRIIDIKFERYTTGHGAEGTIAWIIFEPTA